MTVIIVGVESHVKELGASVSAIMSGLVMCTLRVRPVAEWLHVTEVTVPPLPGVP